VSRRRLIIFATLAFAVFGFFVVRAPAPVIALAAEPVVSIGSYEITNTILSAWVVIVLLAIAAFVVYRRTRDVEQALVPSGFQNFVEAIYEAFLGISQQVGGERNGLKFFPFVFTIFIFLLIGNWFALFPWNNVIGPVENYRYHYLHEMEVSVMEVVEELEEGERELSDAEIDAINNAFIYSFLEPIPFKVDKQDKSDEIIHMIRTEQAYHYDLELSVRNEFARNPIPLGTDGTDIVKEIKARLEAGGVVDEGHDEVKYAMIFNLPLAVGDAELVKATGPILSGDGFKIIPPRTLFAESRDFSYDAFGEPLIIEHGADGSLAALCLIECVYELDDGRIVHQLGDNEPVAVPTTVNTAHLGFILRMEEKGYVDAETGETTGTVGHIFPIFRALASDVNLPLALALWSFLAVQYFGMRGVGIGANFGKYIGVGSHAIVKGPMGVFVGVLEIVSEVGRVISFTFRLFGNIFAGEVVLFISMFLVAFVVPTVFFGLEVFVGFIQAFVFAMLTLVFASTAVGDHDEHHDEAAEH